MIRKRNSSWGDGESERRFWAPSDELVSRWWASGIESLAGASAFGDYVDRVRTAEASLGSSVFCKAKNSQEK